MFKWWESEEYKSELKELVEESERLKEERLKKERKALKEKPEPPRGKGKSVSGKPVDLTDATFTEVVEEIARDYAGRIFFGKLNIDENREVAMQYGIMSIPTLLVFKNGKLVDRIVGAMPRQMLEPKITRYL
jgi:thiol-disulfide isomerase/thioredoxin